MTEQRTHVPHVLLITGAPGIGKTTVIRSVAGRIKAEGIRGFYTEEIRERGERRGFQLIGFDRVSWVIAHVDFTRIHRVGKYGVDVQALDEAATLLRPDPNARVYLVDEIGKMECLSERFVAAMRVLIAGSTPLIASVGARGGGLIAEVKRRPDCKLWKITHANRDALPDRILRWLADGVCPPPGRTVHNSAKALRGRSVRVRTRRDRHRGPPPAAPAACPEAPAT